MSDTISKEQRSKIMASIHGKDTKIEVIVRKYLFHKGFRYRKNVSSLPGKPDLVLKKYNSVIFVHGCFWHQHPFCRIAHIPKSRPEYWEIKLTRNVRRDDNNYKCLEKMGWNVIVIWECQVNNELEYTMQRVINELENNYLRTYVQTFEY